jgi:hypothetical protein
MNEMIKSKAGKLSHGVFACGQSVLPENIQPLLKLKIFLEGNVFETHHCNGELLNFPVFTNFNVYSKVIRFIKAIELVKLGVFSFLGNTRA